MRTNPFVQRYSQFEDKLIQRFHAHGFWRLVPGLTNAQFLSWLVQLGYLSAHFVKWYETAKLGFSMEAAREVIRGILRDEIPVGAPTHQDERLYDLQLMGASTEQVLSTPMTATTRMIVARMYELIRYPQNHYDLRVLVTLRVGGEVMVAEQYRHVVEEMKRRFGIETWESRFYYPHYAHDLKGQSGGGHTDAFDELLASMIVDEESLAIANEAAEKALFIRTGFHDQFLPQPTRLLKRLRDRGGCVLPWVATAAAALLVGLGSMAFVRPTQQERDRREYQTFLASQSPASRQFWLDCDRYMLERFRRTGDTADLEKVGTFASAMEAWSTGP